MHKALYLLSFIAGGAVGALVMKKAIEKKFDGLVKEEIASVKEAFANLRAAAKKEETKEDDEKEVLAEKAVHKPDISKYAEKASTYSNRPEVPRKKKGPNPLGAEKPFAISPDEFGEMYDYERVSLTYYAGDEVLADEDNSIIDDPEEFVGSNFADCIGEYEEDAAYIRNDQKQCDYEILLDTRSYKDVVAYNELMDDDEEGE